MMAQLKPKAPNRRLRVCWAPGLGAAIVIGCCLAGTGPAAAAECYPRCDYNHDYGPRDFTYVRPGLFGYGVCGPFGNCTPWPVYSTSGNPFYRRGRIEIRFPRARLPRS
jgi:hypothetical protein